MTTSEDAFAGLHARYAPELERFLRAMLRNRSAAEEVLQEVWIAAWTEREHRLEDERAWLFEVARRRALHQLRSWRRGKLALARLSAGRPATSAPQRRALEVADLLARHLSPEDRVIVLLRYVHGFTAKEVATMTGRSQDAVHQRLSRACRQLRQAAAPDHLNLAVEASR